MKRLAFSVTALGLFTVAVTSADAQPRPGAERRQPGAFHPLLFVVDADRDGTLSQGEIKTATEKLNKADRDGDGKLTAEELRAAFPFGRGGRSPFRPGGIFSYPGSDRAADGGVG